MTLLLPIHTVEEYRASPRDEATYAPAVAEICRRHGITGAARKYAGGSTIVFAVGGDLVVKLYEQFIRENGIVEERVLRHVDGRLGIPTPGVVARGELDGWRYVVMRQLRGRLLSDAWPDLSADARLRACQQIGRAMARLHALGSDAPALPGPVWAEFIPRQRPTCIDRQRAKGLGDAWLEQIPAFLASVHLPSDAPALLHTEMMREHVMVDDGGEVAGIFDFEPSMLGAPEYDFASAGIFLTGGDPVLWDAFLAAYGLARTARDPEMPRRVMAYALLHRYSNLRWYLDTIPPRAATTLDALAQEWFGWD
jgi:hygromycin-B 7''-O-kinase